jgi:hypothetical protein
MVVGGGGSYSVLLDGFKFSLLEEEHGSFELHIFGVRSCIRSTSRVTE